MHARKGLQRGHVVSTREIDERFLRLALRDIGLQQPLHQRRNFVKGNALRELAPESAFLLEATAASMHVFETLGRTMFCQTVTRSSPLPKSSASCASPRICATLILPTGMAIPIADRPAWRWT